MADPDAMGNTYTQVISKSWTCGDSPGLFTTLVSPGVSAEGVGVISSMASCGPHTTVCFTGVLPPEGSSDFVDVGVRLGPTFLRLISLCRRELNLGKSREFRL